MGSAVSKAIPRRSLPGDVPAVKTRSLLSTDLLPRRPSIALWSVGGYGRRKSRDPAWSMEEMLLLSSESLVLGVPLPLPMDGVLSGIHVSLLACPTGGIHAV